MSILKTETALPAYAPAEQTVVGDVVSAFFRSKNKIALASLLLMLLVSGTIALDHKSYESRLLFMVRDEGSAFPIESIGNRDDVQLGPASDTQIGTEIELLSSMDLHRLVISRLHPDFTSAQIDRELLSFDKLLQVLPVPKTTLINVTYSASSAQAANNTLAILSKLYLDYRSKIRGSDGAYAFFDQQANKYYAMLQNDQKQIADFDQKNQVTLIGEEKDVTVHRLADARASLYDNEASLVEAQKRIQTMNTARQTLPPRVVTQRRDLPDQQTAGRLNSELVDLQNERVALLTKYHPTDRHVLEVDEKIANLSEALKRAQESKATEEASDLNPIRQTVDSDLEQATFRAAGLQARERSLSYQMNAYSTKLQDLNRVTAESDDLARKIKEDEASYELYAAKRESARINKTLDGDKIANVRAIAGPSIVPHARGQLAMSAVLLYVIGFFLISGGGIVAGLWSPRFHSPKELEAALGAPVLATIPVVPEFARKEANAEQALGRIARKYGAPPPIIENALLARNIQGSRPEWPRGQMARYTVGILNDGGRRGGMYLSLIERMRRQRSLRPGIGSVFAFTSCNRGEGVSHFVRGLGAELMDFTGKRVAIVNALDSFESANEFTDLSQEDLPSTGPRGGEDFLHQWFQRLRAEHDYVLIDCPALSTSHAAAVFGPQSDGLLLVVEAGRATRSQLRGGLAMLSLASVPVMGLALNKRRYPVPAAIYNLL